MSKSKPMGYWPSTPPDNPAQNSIDEQMSAEFLVALEKVKADYLSGLLQATHIPNRFEASV